MAAEEVHPIATLVASRKGEAEVAADLKKRFEDAMLPALVLMDEANHEGLAIQFDGIAISAPIYRHRILNLRVIKQY
jgi:hypothetical protein